jgi:phage baseplate assembly protein V
MAGVDAAEKGVPIMPAFRVGIVQEQDVERARVRVVFPDYDQMVSWWLFVVFPKTQNDKAYWMPDVGEQVLCLMDDHDEDGAVLGAVYSQVDTTPVQSGDKWHVTMQDGAKFEYDRSSHQFVIQLPNGTALQMVQDISLTTNLFATSINTIILLLNAMILIYLTHVHPDPQGGVTGIPVQQGIAPVQEI